MTSCKVSFKVIDRSVRFNFTRNNYHNRTPFNVQARILDSFAHKDWVNVLKRAVSSGYGHVTAGIVLTLTILKSHRQCESPYPHGFESSSILTLRSAHLTGRRALPPSTNRVLTCRLRLFVSQLARRLNCGLH
jgi:hypothetical protein